MDGTTRSLAPRPEDLIEAGEELLMKARAVAHRIEERVWRTMDGEPLPPPHGTAAGVQDDGLAVAAE